MSALKAMLFCMINDNDEFAVHILRMVDPSILSEERKTLLCTILDIPRHVDKFSLPDLPFVLDEPVTYPQRDD